MFNFVRMSPERFVRLALVVAALWLLVVYPGLNWFFPDYVPPGMSLPENATIDFGQYYAGAVAAKNGLWDSLYPRMRADGAPIGDKLQLTIATPEVSDFAPAILEKCPELKTEFSFRFVYPPPLALLVQPLAHFSFWDSCRKVWPTLAILALFGRAYLMARTYRAFTGRASYIEGLIIIGFVLFTYRGRTAIVDGNATPIVALFITLSFYCWIRNWQLGLGLPLIGTMLFKGIGLNWCPLLLLKPVRWRALLAMAFTTLLLNGAVLALAGPGVYRAYFSDVLPRMIVPVGFGIPSQLFQQHGIFSQGFYNALSWAICSVFYLGYWKRMRSGGDNKACMAAVLAATMAVFCLFNFSVWLTYFPNFLYFPAVGWLIWEGQQARGAWRRWLLGGAAFLMVITSFDWIIDGCLRHLLGQLWADAHHELILTPAYTILGPLLFMVAAFRRLFIQHGNARAQAPLGTGTRPTRIGGEIAQI